MIHLLDESQINQEVVRNSGRLMLLNVYADWCLPCEILSPILTELDKKYKNVEFYKVNSDEASNFSTINNITSIPTLIFYKDGEEKERIVGVECLDKISNVIEEYIIRLSEYIDKKWDSYTDNNKTIRKRLAKWNVKKKSERIEEWNISN